ncbi:signal peptidase I [Mycoplasmatota bacterium WC44]
MAKSEKRVSILLITISLFYLYPFLIPELTDYLSSFELYVKPLFWLLVSIYILSLNKVKSKAKRRYLSYIILWVFISAFIYIFAYFLVGFIDGFGKNPYDTTLKGFLFNLLLYGSVIILREFARNYLVNSVPKKRISLFSIFIVIVYSLIDVNLNNLISLSSPEDIISFVISKVGVIITFNIFMTYISHLAGYIPCIIYALLIQLPLWILNVIPNLTWLSSAVIGLMIPVLALILISDLYKKMSRQVKRVQYSKQNLYSWIITGFISVCIVWFVVGVFPVAPTVILTGSMEPVIYPGDVCIIKKVNIDDVEIGDVVQYWTGDYFIIHRVIETYEESGNKFYITKGDNNPSKDSKPVSQEQIKGVHIYTIPKVGKPLLMLKSKSDEDINEEIMNSSE